MHREIEIKFDVATEVGLPDLAGLPGVARVGDPVEHDLEAVYYDTADLALARARRTLRRRSGGPDAGWHHKRPVPDGSREELHEPLSADDAVPESMLKAVRSFVRDNPVGPVVRLKTHRVVHPLVDAADVVLAEVADDTVTAQHVDQTAAVAESWREWEAELAAGDRDLLQAIGQRLQDAGAMPAAGPSKLARALGDRLGRPATLEGSARDGSAALVVQAHLREQVDEILNRDPLVREDVPDALHKMRVATRRLRSALATYRPLYDREVTDPVRDELKWLATELGVARDAEVMRDRLLALLAEQPPELILGPVARRIDLELHDAYRTAHAHVLETLESERYFRLLDRLDALVAEPPLTSLANKPAEKVLPRRVTNAYHRVRSAVEEADAAGDQATHDHLLHEVRKAAKRARYAGESLTDSFGPPAKDFAKAMERLQEVLGEHQDSVVSRDLIRELGVRANLKGENALTFGRLHAQEESSAEETEAAYREAWEAASAKSLRGWL